MVRYVLISLLKTLLLILSLPIVFIAGLFFGLVIMPFITLKEVFDEIWADFDFYMNEGDKNK